MKQIIQAAIDLKIPSIVILVIFGVLAYNFLKTNPPVNGSQGIAGFICLIVTIFSGIYAFLEQMIKERYESIIKIQHTAMEKLSKTHSTFEDSQQRSITENLSEKSQEKYMEVNPSTETKT